MQENTTSRRKQDGQSLLCVWVSLLVPVQLFQEQAFCNFQFDKGGDCMKLKHKIVIEILLVIAAIAVFIYNFSMQREIAYIASIVAVCGTIALLIKDIVKWKKNK